MIAGIDRCGGLQGLYPQYSTARVAAVRPVKQNETTAYFIKNNKREESGINKEKYEGKVSMKYAENNPYEQNRKMIDEGFLAGMNVDMYV